MERRLTLVGTETLRAPRYVLIVRLDRRGEPRDGITKEPTGFYIDTVFRYWKCRCGKTAVTVGEYTSAPTCSCQR